MASQFFFTFFPTSGTCGGPLLAIDGLDLFYFLFLAFFLLFSGLLLVIHARNSFAFSLLCPRCMASYVQEPGGW